MNCRTLCVLLLLAGCTPAPPPSDGGVDGAIRDAAADGGACLALQPRTVLYEDNCRGGLQGYCFYETPPMGLF